MLFLHPNPLDGSCWLYQMAHLATWFRCVAVDLPGYGLSPASDGPFTMQDVARACWAALDEETDGGSRAVLVGCSVGATLAQYMNAERPDATAALVLCGTGYYPTKSFAAARKVGYERQGISYRQDYAFEDFSRTFAQSDLARWYVDLLRERDTHADLPTILRLMDAMAVPDPPDLQTRISAPVLLIRGSEDAAFEHAGQLAERIHHSHLVTLNHAGHACFMEQPHAFDTQVINFLRAHQLLHSRNGGAVSRHS
jgi:3-oxoadipate enol-lactonase/4-carboxymuconolactone decarboxylase